MGTLRSAIARVTQQEELNFFLTNNIPRRLATRFIGWFSRIEQPLVRDFSLATWRLFADLDLSDAHKQSFRSLHDCFVRRLKDGARPINCDPALLVSPCDAIVGACGRVEDGQVLQVKGSRYPLRELLRDDAYAAEFRNGVYATLRLTSSMYHRFHAPHDGRVESVTYVPGDTWNVNPPTLRRIEKLYCRNERAIIRVRLARSGHTVALVPVAAILVAGIRLGFIDAGQALRVGGARTLPCRADLTKGEEMGWFEHGSTILVFAPEGFELCDGACGGARIRVGLPLMRLPGTPGCQSAATA